MGLIRAIPLTGSLVLDNRRVVIRNRIYIVEDIKDIKGISSKVFNNRDDLKSAVLDSLGFDPFPLPFITYVGDEESNTEILEQSGLIEGVLYLGKKPTVAPKIEFNGNTSESFFGANGTGGQFVNSGTYSLTVYPPSSIRPTDYNNPTYVGASRFNPIEFVSSQPAGTLVIYNFLIGTQNNIDDSGKIIDTNFYRYRFEITPRNNGTILAYGVYYSSATIDYTLLANYEPPPPTPTDPYAPGGTSGSGGGAGSFDTSSDPVDFSQLPTLSAVSAGFISLFNPTNAELQSLAAKIWSTDFLDALTRFFSDPADLIIGLSIVPVIPPTGGKVEVQAGFIPTGVSMNKITTQYVNLSCGSVAVVPFYDAALDYSPFTKLSVYLPFIGVRSLDVDECMGQTLAISYNIDLLTGSCVAEIKCGNAVLYTFNGTVSSEIPTSSRSFDTLVSAGIQAVASLGTAVATGGGSTAAAAISATANAIMSAKPEIIRSGNASSTAGLLAGKVPYLIYQIPRQSMPENNNTFVGYPANITVNLGSVSGFTQVSDIHLTSVPATGDELAELENILKGGVIL